jgi:hypothetical protein
MISPCLVDHAELGRTTNNSAHTLNFNPQFAAHHKTPSLIEALNDGCSFSGINLHACHS